MAQYGFGGSGDFSQEGQNYSQFAPRRRKLQPQQEQQAIGTALDGGLGGYGAEPTTPPIRQSYPPPQQSGGFTGGKQPSYTIGTNPNYQGGPTVQGGGPGHWNSDGSWSGVWGPNGEWLGNGSMVIPRSSTKSPAVGTTAADQLTQAPQEQAVQQALGGPSLEETFAGTQRRGGSTWGPGSGAVTGAGYGASVGNVIPGLGTAIGAGIGGLVGGVAGMFHKKASTAPTDFSRADAEKMVAAAYREYLGREASPQEIQTHLNNVGAGGTWVGEQGLQGIVNAINSSPEAQAYAANQAVPPATASVSATPTTPAPDSSGWDTDSYAKPAYTAASPGSALSGWDATKWADPNHQTPKYVVGRIVSQYGADDAGFAKAVAEIQKAYPGTTTDGKDKVTIPGVGTIDIRTGATQGGTGYAWQPLTNPDGSPSAGTGTSGPASSGGSTGPIDTSWAYGGAVNTTRSLIDKLMQELGVAGALGR